MQSVYYELMQKTQMTDAKRQKSNERVKPQQRLSLRPSSSLTKQLGLLQRRLTVLDEHLLVIDDRDIGSCQVLDLAVFDFPELFGDLGDEACGWVGE